MSRLKKSCKKVNHIHIRSYFELPYEPEEFLAEFGYSLEKTVLSLPKFLKH